MKKKPIIATLCLLLCAGALGRNRRSPRVSRPHDKTRTEQSVRAAVHADRSTHRDTLAYRVDARGDTIRYAIAADAYEELYHIRPAIMAIHAGLECGLFLTKYPELDMVSFGPTLQNVHSPSERMFIPAVDRYWNQLKRIIEKVADLKD